MKCLFCTVIVDLIHLVIKSTKKAHWYDSQWGYDIRMIGREKPRVMLWFEDNRGFIDHRHAGLALGWFEVYWYTGAECGCVLPRLAKKEQYDDTIPF